MQYHESHRREPDVRIVFLDGISHSPHKEIHRTLESRRLFTLSVMGLFSYGDKADSGDHDYAAAKTVEDLAVAGSDHPGWRQGRKIESWEASHSSRYGLS
ncbi:MAG: hypothetical protein R6V83_12265 [Candidatus Thorarchaeota archaeon]